MPVCRRSSACLLLAFFAATAATAQDLAEEFPPGMLARYTAGEKTIERVDASVAFDWGRAAPDQRLPQGPFEAQWTSWLLLRQEAAYRFHAFVQGEVRIEVDGAVVLEGRSDAPGWISGDEVRLGFGEKAFAVTFRKTADAAQVRLFWSSDHFALEPIPTYLLYRDESTPGHVTQIERGRRLFESHRCNRCHRRQNDELSPPAPALTNVATGMNAEWLLHKLRQPHKSEAGALMPTFGHSESEALAIAAWLTRNTEKIAFDAAAQGRDSDADRHAGELLFRSMGCLACHRVGESGSAQPGGGDLSQIGAKRSREWLSTWLSDPERLNVDHRMPVFELSGDETRQLTEYLAGLGKNANSDAHARTETPDDASAEEGLRLVTQARCAACHRLPEALDPPAALPDLSAGIDDWSGTCLDDEPDPETGRPAFPGIDREAVKAYLNSRRGPLSPKSPYDRGRLVLERRNCLACHERDGSSGIVPIAGSISQADQRLAGQSEALIPPPLTAVGDRMHDAALADAVNGEQKNRRLSWLRVRMPRFEHAAEDKAALLAYLISRDRIPDDAPGVPDVSNPRAGGETQTLVAGHALVGVTGFSCIACHKVGSYEPRNVALGTRGSDLWMLGKRMRRDFFLRWTMSPQRIVPGMEMPAIKKAVPGVLGEDVRAQLLAIWDALNDPNFTPPTNPASVEQFLTVAPGEPPRIVRDVFTLPKSEGGGYVARAMVIGLNNGHNILFDFDTCSIRQWTFGDFARQRTEGKSWYWDMAGVPVMTGFTSQPGILLRDVAMGTVHEPLVENNQRARPVRWSTTTRDGVSSFYFEYDLRFETSRGVETVHIVEQYGPKAGQGTQPPGWSRFVIAELDRRLSGENRTFAEEGLELLVDCPRPERSEVDGSIGLEPRYDARWTEIEGRDQRIFAVCGNVSDGSGLYGALLHYRSPLKREVPAAPTIAAPAALSPEPITSVPGYEGSRLPLDRGIMPTALTWTHDGALAFTSLKGHVYLARDTDGDELEDELLLYYEGLAAPYGILAEGSDLVVSHKPELVRLKDDDHDGRADTARVVADGWGYCDNYHDWTCGIVRDAAGNLYVGLGSDYSQPERKKETARWRGKILRIGPDGEVTPIAHSFRYPTGLAINAEGELFATDNQGVQNTFNELNHIVEGRHYGVPSRFEEQPDAPVTPPAIQIPHPWTRSVNGIAFLPADADSPFAGQGLGCDYDTRTLVRFSLQEIEGEYQGAVYPFSRPDAGVGGTNFTGPLSIAVSPKGDLYIGSIYDSGWLGGRNTGDIARLRPSGNLPNGIRELRAVPGGFEIDFIHPVEVERAADPASYNISGYTRVWEGAYATPDSGRYRVTVESASVSDDGRRVTLTCDDLREGFVYEVTCGAVSAEMDDFWPATGHYTMRRLPDGAKAPSLSPP